MNNINNKLNHFKNNEVERQIDNYSDNIEVLFDYNHLLFFHFNIFGN